MVNPDRTVWRKDIARSWNFEYTHPNIMKVLGISVFSTFVIASGLIIIAIFSKETNRTTVILGTCDARGGECVLGLLQCDEGQIIPKMDDCEDKDEICCVTI